MRGTVDGFAEVYVRDSYFLDPLQQTGRPPLDPELEELDEKILEIDLVLLLFLLNKGGGGLIISLSKEEAIW